MFTRKLLATTALATILFSAAGCDQGAAETQPSFTSVGPNDSEVQVTIDGGGSVAYTDSAAMPCTSDGASVTCSPVKWTGGAGSIVATPATGWRFDGWSLYFGSLSGNAMSNPKSATQEILPGTSVALIATFVPLVHPIQATFSQEIFSTSYQIDVDNPDLDVIKVEWSGPNCGSFDPTESIDSQKVTSFQMTWAHPHGPQYPNSCDATTNHADVTITAKVTIKDKTFTCTYQGAETGVGPACK